MASGERRTAAGRIEGSGGGVQAKIVMSCHGAWLRGMDGWAGGYKQSRRRAACGYLCAFVHNSGTIIQFGNPNFVKVSNIFGTQLQFCVF